MGPPIVHRYSVRAEKFRLPLFLESFTAANASDNVTLKEQEQDHEWYGRHNARCGQASPIDRVGQHEA